MGRLCVEGLLELLEPAVVAASTRKFGGGGMVLPVILSQDEPQPLQVVVATGLAEVVDVLILAR